MAIYSFWLFKFWPFSKYAAICIGRIILFKASREHVSTRLVAHEQIHQGQMDRMGVIRFYAVYLYYWVAGVIRFRSFSKAYRENPLEKEAYGD